LTAWWNFSLYFAADSFTIKLTGDTEKRARKRACDQRLRHRPPLSPFGECRVCSPSDFPKLLYPSPGSFSRTSPIGFQKEAHHAAGELGMRVLIAEDNSTTRSLLQEALTDWGFEVLAASDGKEAWQQLAHGEAPQLILLDWTMPEMDGIEVCRAVRQLPHFRTNYIILLTARNSPDDVVVGLEAGADDYITKPFEPAELRARLQVGVRIVALQHSLARRVDELENALARVKQLHGLLPICSYCKKIRDDQNYWQQVEAYISSHTDAQFSHGVCPDCYERILRPEMEAFRNKILSRKT
jgi:CheY-like chemotaxis protein